MSWHVERLRSTSRIALALLCFLTANHITFARTGPFTPSSVFIEHTYSDLKLKQGASPTPAFTSKNVTCPANRTKGCTIRVKTSIEVTDVPPDGSIWETVFESGVMQKVLTLEPTQGDIPSQRTLQFEIQNVQAGSTVTIDVQLQNQIGTAHAKDRVEMVELLLN